MSLFLLSKSCHNFVETIDKDLEYIEKSLAIHPVFKESWTMKILIEDIAGEK